MGLRRFVKKVFGHLVNYRVDQWIAYDYLKSSATYFYSLSRSLFRSEYPQFSETFEEAVERLNLTPEELTTKIKLFKHCSDLFLMLSFCLLCYGLYVYLQDNWMGAIMSLGLSICALSQAFRFHFWYFQIKTQKLGCGLKEWLNYSLGKKL